MKNRKNSVIHVYRAGLWSRFGFAASGFHTGAVFSQGKTMRVVQARAAGGTGDMRVRAQVSDFAQIYSRQSDHCSRVHGGGWRPNRRQPHLPHGPARRPDHRRHDSRLCAKRGARRNRSVRRSRQDDLPRCARRQRSTDFRDPQGSWRRQFSQTPGNVWPTHWCPGGRPSASILPVVSSPTCSD